MSETTIASVERRDRLLRISALSVIILTLPGAAGEKSGMDRAMKANTVTYRTHSLFRQGCY
ncbi:MAG: IS4 family transposase, partial [Proteobacteria bacterium]|nr:IS4 family transposase [Pseudomonadota bacterium]